MKKKPQSGQTFYTVDGINQTAKIEKHFIVSVKMSKLVETNMGVKSTFQGQNENGILIMSQELLREKRNHLILLTSSGKAFDYSYGTDKLYFTKKQANKAYRKALRTFVFLEESHSFVVHENFGKLLEKARGLR